MIFILDKTREEKGNHIMPNWCENRLIIRAESGVFTCLEAIRGETDEHGRRHIDFQKIVPMPAILTGTLHPTPQEWFVLLQHKKRGRTMPSYPSIDEAEMRYLHALLAYEQTGYWNWYDWRVGKAETRFLDGHWGTKWNACCSIQIGNANDRAADIHFLTAWSPPVPVIRDLSRNYPDLAFTLKYFEPRCEIHGTLRMRSGRILPAKPDTVNNRIPSRERTSPNQPTRANICAQPSARDVWLPANSFGLPPLKSSAFDMVPRLPASNTTQAFIPRLHDLCFILKIRKVTR